MDSQGWGTKAEFEALSESFESLNLQSVVIDSATYVHTHTISSASASYVRMYILQINSLVIRNQLKVCIVPTSHLLLQCNAYPSQAVSGSLCF